MQWSRFCNRHQLAGIIHQYSCGLLPVLVLLWPPLGSAQGTQPPSIISQPSAQVANPGDRVTFTTLAIGDTPLFAQWEKDGTNILGATSFAFIIDPVTKADEGFYRCVLSNQWGTAQSDAVALTVNDPVVILEHPANQFAPVGGDFSLSATASGTPPLSYAWLKDGNVIMPFPGQPTLTVSAVEFDDAGAYWCVISNMVGAVTTETAHVTITAPLPDLAITSLSSPAEITLGVPFVVSWTATNRGSAITNAWQDSLYLVGAHDGGFVTNVLGTVDAYGIVPLAGGSGYTRQLEVVVRTPTPYSNTILRLVLDANHEVDELETHNNATNRGVSFRFADLKPLNFAAPASVVHGEVISIEWDVVNQGTGQPHTGWEDRLYISDFNEWNSFRRLVHRVTHDPDLQGGTARRTSIQYSTSTLPVGTYWFFVEIDGAMRLIDVDRSNNRTTHGVPIEVRRAPAPELTPLTIQAPPTAWGGDDIKTGYEVRNTGDAALKPSDHWREMVAISSQPDFSLNTRLLGSWTSAGPLQINGQYGREQSVTLPTSAAGAQYLRLQIQSPFSHNTVQTSLFVNRLPLPDLHVPMFVVPSAAESGEAITVSFAVGNQGGSSASGHCSYSVWLSADTTLDPATDVRIDEGSIPISLDSNQHTPAIHRVVRIPDGLSGNWFLILAINSDGSIEESTVANNYRVAFPGLSVSLADYPDLQVSGLQWLAGHQPRAGETYAVTMVVSNAGVISATAPWRDEINLIPQDTGRGQRLFTATRNEPLEPGAYYSISVTGQISRGLSPGMYQIEALTDADNRIFEIGDPENNRQTMSVLVEPPDLPDAQPVSLSAPHTLTNGALFQVELAMVNNGPGWLDPITATFDLIAEGNPGAQYELAEHRLPGNWPSGHQTNLTFRMQTTGDVPPDTYRVRIRVNTDAQVAETNYENNETLSASPVILVNQPLPDLVWQTLDMPQQAQAGQIVPVHFTLANQGSSALSGNRVRIGWSLAQVDHQGHHSDPILLRYTEHAFEIEHSQPGYAELLLPYHVEGSWLLLAMIDPARQIAETNKANNQLSRALDIIPRHLPDLQIPSAEVISPSVAGEPLTIRWRVANAGLGPTLNHWQDAVHVTTATWTNSVLQGAARLLGASESYEWQVTLTPPLSTGGEVAQIQITTDINNREEEATTNNNTRHLSLLLQPGSAADLSIHGGSLPTSVLAGQSFDLPFTIENVGERMTRNDRFSVDVHLSADREFNPASDIRVARLQAGQHLMPGASAAATNATTTPYTILGHFYVILSLNMNEQEPELGRLTNNLWISDVPLTLLPAPVVDLDVTAVAGPDTVYAGQRAPITWRERNRGTEVVEGRWLTRVYLSETEDVTAAARLLGWLESEGPLAPGEELERSLDVEWPGAVPGAYRILVVSDVRKQLNDSDRANNRALSLNPTRLNIREVDLGRTDTGTWKSGSVLYWRYVPAYEQMDIEVDFASMPASEVLLLAARGRIPTPANHDVQAYHRPLDTGLPVLHLASDEEYFIAVIPQDRSGEEGAYAVRYAEAPLRISSVSPRASGRTSTTSFSIRGARLWQGEFALRAISTGIEFSPEKSTLLPDGQRIVRFNMRVIPSGDYQMVVKSPIGETHVYEPLISVVEGGGPRLEYWVEGPSQVSDTRDRTFYAHFINRGNTDARGLLYLIEVPNGHVVDLYNSLGGLIDSIADHDGRIIILAPYLAPGDRDTIKIVIRGQSATSITIVGIATGVADDAIQREIEEAIRHEDEDFRKQVEDLGSVSGYLSYEINQIRRSAQNEAEIQREIVEVVRAYIEDEPSQVVEMTREEWVSRELDRYHNESIFSLFLQFFETFVGNYKASIVNRLKGFDDMSAAFFEIWENEVNLGNVFQLVFDHLENIFRTATGSAFVGQSHNHTVSFVTARDPNDKLGPEGHGMDRYVDADQYIEYTIRFENMADVQAPAQVVEILDPLSAELDWSSFQLLEYGFGDFVRHLPLGAPSIYEILDFTDTHGFNLQVDAGIDLDSGMASWLFTTLDPATGDVPEDGAIGFLPPNVTPPEGDGFVRFRIRPRTDIISGTVVSNYADIVFVPNESIRTPAVYNTIDSGSPTSWLTFSGLSGDGAQINWTSVDDPLGSGIREVLIYQSVDNQPYRVVHAGAPEGQASLPVTPRSVYRLYSIAIDQTGRSESPPAQPDIVFQTPGLLLNLPPVIEFSAGESLSLLPYLVGSAPTTNMTTALGPGPWLDRGWSFTVEAGDLHAGRQVQLRVRLDDGTTAQDYETMLIARDGDRPPEILVLNPPADMHAEYLSPSILVSGIAAPGDHPLASVDYRLNDSAWASATGTSNWTAQVTALHVGTNRVEIRARDVLGGMSPTAHRHIVRASPPSSTPPSFVLHPASRSVDPGERIVLGSLAEGFPPPAYQWWHQGQPVSGATNQQLEILSAAEIHGGSYFVLASNSEAVVTSLTAVVTVLTPENAIIPDSDGDGLPDWWELKHSGSITGLIASADLGGGFTVLDAFHAGLTPDPESEPFRMVPLPLLAAAPGGGILVSWQSVPERMYDLGRNTNLVTGGFGLIAENLPSTPPANIYHDSLATNAHVYAYRLRSRYPYRLSSMIELEQPPRLEVSTNHVALKSAPGGSAGAALEIWNSGGGTMPFHISSNADWLEVHPPDGISTGQVVTVTLSADATDFQPGDYQGLLTLSAPSADPDSTPLLIAVSLDVHESSRQLIFFDDFSAGLDNWDNVFNDNWTIQGEVLVGDYDIRCGSVTCRQADIILADLIDVPADFSAVVSFINTQNAHGYPNYFTAQASFTLWNTQQERFAITVGRGGSYTDTTPWGGVQTNVTVTVETFNNTWSHTFNTNVSLSWNPDEWNNAEIRKSGNRYDIYLNNQFLAVYHDNFMNGSGRIGLHAYGTRRYDNFTIWSESPQLYAALQLSGSIEFGEVSIGENGVRTLFITNTGNGLLTITNLSYHPGFTTDWTSGSIQPGATQTVAVIFSPTEAMAYSGQIIVHSDATSGSNSIQVSGTGIEESPHAGDYLVIDLSGGPSASSYPVSSLAAVPPGGWTDEYKTTNLVLRRIPAGTFLMGSPTNELGRSTWADETQHTVTLTQDFYIGVFEVTQRQWERVMGTWPSEFANATDRDSRPVERVLWHEIRGGTWPGGDAASGTFVQRISARTGLNFDLPTEAQWEYACRAGTTTALNSGYNLTSESSDPRMDEVGRYWHNVVWGEDGAPSEATSKVGSYLPNSWGLYDMHGNVWEWCLDWYGSYPGTVTNPVGATSASYRVSRGGSWFDQARLCRSARRPGGPVTPNIPSEGFRAALPVGPADAP